MVLYETSDGTKFFDCRLLFYMQHCMNKEAQSLLERHMNSTESIDSSGKTLLHYAVSFKNSDIVQYLIAKGCNVNAKDIVGNSPLMLAVNAMDTSMIDLLLDANADIFLRDGCCDCSPLQIALSYPSVERATEIMKKFLCVLQKACDHNPQEVAKKLIEAECPFSRTVLFGNVELMKSMLQQGCFVDSRDRYLQGFTALQMAVRTVNLEAVKFLLDHGADVNAVDKCQSSVLHYYEPDKPESDERLAILRMLIDCGAVLNMAEEKSAKLAGKFLSRGGLQTVRLILKTGIDLHARVGPNNGVLYFPLFFALILNSHKIVDELRGRALDFNLRDYNGRSSLFHAKVGNPDVVEFLLENGTDPNVVDYRGCTVLFCVFSLLAKEKNLDAKKVEHVELLLQYNANSQFKTNDGKTIFDIALQHKDSKLIFLILQDLAIKQALGQPIDNVILNQISSYMPFVAQFTAYKDEIVKMEKHVLCGSITSFKLLTESKQKILAYLRIEEVFTKVIGILEYAEGRKKLTPYSYIPNVLIKRLNRFVETTTLRKKAFDVLSKIDRLKDDPYVISMLILYFDDQDLRNICKV